MEISVGIGKQYGRHIFRLKYMAAPFDPTKRGDDSLEDDILSSIGLSPSWNYRGRINTVSLVLVDRPKMNSLAGIFIAVIMAVIIGILGNVIPDNARQIINDSLLTQISDSFFELLNTFSGIMFFLTICKGMVDMCNSARLGNIGKPVLGGFISASFAIGAVSVVGVLPFVKLNYSTARQGAISAVGQISQMIFDILPENIVDPFRTGNTFQIITIPSSSATNRFPVQ